MNACLEEQLSLVHLHRLFHVLTVARCLGKLLRFRFLRPPWRIKPISLVSAFAWKCVNREEEVNYGLFDRSM